MNKTQIQGSYNNFQQGHISVESEVHLNWLSTSRNKESIEKVWQIVMENYHVTIKEITHKVETNTVSVHSISMEDLCKQRVSAKNKVEHTSLRLLCSLQDQRGLAISCRSYSFKVNATEKKEQ